MRCATILVALLAALLARPAVSLSITAPPQCLTPEGRIRVKACVDIEDDNVIMYPSDRLEGWDPSFFRVSTRVQDVRQFSSAGFVLAPVINDWNFCSLTANRSEPLNAVQDLYHETIITCLAVGGPQGVFMRTSIRYYFHTINITDTANHTDVFTIGTNDIKISYTLGWSNDAALLNENDVLQFEVSTTYSFPTSLWALWNMQVNKIPSSEEAFSLVAESAASAAASGTPQNMRGFRADTATVLDVRYPDTAVKCGRLSCAEEFGYQAVKMTVNSTIDNVEKLGPNIFGIGAAVDVPTKVVATMRVKGVTPFVTIDPLVAIDGDGIIFSGATNTKMAALIGACVIVGMSFCCTCICCFACKCCPIAKFRARNKLMQARLDNLTTSTGAVKYTKATEVTLADAGVQEEEPDEHTRFVTSPGSSKVGPISPASVVPIDTMDEEHA